MVKFRPNLFIGNSFDAQRHQYLRKNNIKAVLNVAFDLNDPFCSDIQWYKVGLIDGDGNIPWQIKIARDLLTDLCVAGQMNNSNVLIHCHEGLSRSVYIAYIHVLNSLLEKPDKVRKDLDSLIIGHKLDRLHKIFGDFEVKV